PHGRRWLLYGTRGQAEVVEVPELAVVRDDRAFQRGIEDVEDFIVAGTRFVVPEADLRHFIGDARRRSDPKSPAGEMIQHADLFDQLPGGMIGRYHAKRSQPQSRGARSDAGNEQVRSRRIGCAEMVLAEEDALEARRLGARP